MSSSDPVERCFKNSTEIRRNALSNAVGSSSMENTCVSVIIQETRVFQRNVFKNPTTDSGKRSKKGLLTLEKKDGVFHTVQEGLGDPEKVD